MVTEYLGSVSNKHGLTRYTLSTGLEVILTEEEAEELCLHIDKNLYLNSNEALEAELQSMEEESALLAEELEELKHRMGNQNTKDISIESIVEMLNTVDPDTDTKISVDTLISVKHLLDEELLLILDSIM